MTATEAMKSATPTPMIQETSSVRPISAVALIASLIPAPSAASPIRSGRWA